MMQFVWCQGDSISGIPSLSPNTLLSRTHSGAGVTHKIRKFVTRCGGARHRGKSGPVRAATGSWRSVGRRDFLRHRQALL